MTMNKKAHINKKKKKKLKSLNLTVMIFFLFFFFPRKFGPFCFLTP